MPKYVAKKSAPSAPPPSPDLHMKVEFDPVCLSDLDDIEDGGLVQLGPPPNLPINIEPMTSYEPEFSSSLVSSDTFTENICKIRKTRPASST